jgi:hypothetical protein
VLVLALHNGQPDSLASSFQESGPNETLIKNEGNVGHKLNWHEKYIGRHVQGRTIHAYYQSTRHEINMHLVPNPLFTWAQKAEA